MEQLIREERTLADLFTELLDETRLLVRQEISLARVEMANKARGFARDIAMMAFAALLLFVAFQVLVATAILILDLVLPAWLSALIVGVALAAIGVVLGVIGLRNFQNRGVAPEDTIETLKEDREWIRDQTR
ncbi:MAG: phage holin family protein [Chloroflexi bacterium]|jgi:uncharacterized membrane protein YqjE|nr:phage holin family protein [Chloroflexota bacterium]